jgi:hypothetical protein
MPPKDLGKAYGPARPHPDITRDQITDQTEISSNLAGGILNLTVGPSETPFDVHLELLCDCSPYFNPHLSERFDDTFIKELAFPEDDPEAFADFIR